mgnify:CR=1 FL=1
MSRISSILVLLIFIVVFPSTYFLYHSSKDGAVEEIIAASQSDDVNAMAERFDWESVRQNLKDKITAQKRTMGNYGTLIGPDISKVDEIVDYYLKPENIEIAYIYHDILFPEVTEEQFIRNIAYAPPFGFSILMGYPKDAPSTQSVDPLLQEELEARFIFRLDGLTWKVKEINIPIFMIPTRTYSQPALQHFKQRAGAY